jgi:hypothetical protein
MIEQQNRGKRGTEKIALDGRFIGLDDDVN